MMTNTQQKYADLIMNYYYESRFTPSVIDNAFISKIDWSVVDKQEHCRDVRYVRDVLLEEDLIENDIGSITNEDYCKITSKGVSVIQKYNTYKFYKWKEEQENKLYIKRNIQERKNKKISYYLGILLTITSIIVAIIK